MLAVGAASGALAARGGADLDPAGVWSCVAYTEGSYRDRHFLLDLGATGAARLARQGEGGASDWFRTRDWTVSRGYLVVEDPRARRELVADLRFHTLGGMWTSESDGGGWWCARRLDAAAAERNAAQWSAAELFVPPLVSYVIGSPTYPREAIRAAKTGRAVVCFVVDPDGVVREPEFLELTDEVFREATLYAVMRTQYRPWNGDVARPACRSFGYELERVRDGT